MVDVAGVPFRSEAFSIDPELVRSLKRSEYDQMVELGLFQDERVELIRGVLVKMSAHLASHASTVQKLNQLLMTRLQGRFSLRIQSPLALSDDSELEPDVAVVPLGDYEVEHPSTALLIIEVADTTLRKDRAKAAVYASAGIGEYWIVNLGARTVEVYASPDGDRYAEVRTLRAGDALRPAALVDVAIAVSLRSSCAGTRHDHPFTAPAVRPETIRKTTMNIVIRFASQACDAMVVSSRAGGCQRELTQLDAAFASL